jgi:hypothetical protein
MEQKQAGMTDQKSVAILRLAQGLLPAKVEDRDVLTRWPKRSNKLWLAHALPPTTTTSSWRMNNNERYSNENGPRQ